MDLVTYLENNNIELYQKLKEIVKLYKEKEEDKKRLIILNNAYNAYLTEKHESEFNKRKSTKTRKENILDKLEDMDPLMLFWIFMLLPTHLMIIVALAIPLLKMYKLVNKKAEELSRLQDECLGMFEKFNQDLRYEQLCEAREQYHTKRKELDKVLLTMSKEDIELISDFYGALKEYDELLDNIANDLEENKQLPQVPQEEIHKTLEHRNV